MGRMKMVKEKIRLTKECAQAIDTGKKSGSGQERFRCKVLSKELGYEVKLGEQAGICQNCQSYKYKKKSKDILVNRGFTPIFLIRNLIFE